MGRRPVGETAITSPAGTVADRCHRFRTENPSRRSRVSATLTDRFLKAAPFTRAVRFPALMSLWAGSMLLSRRPTRNRTEATTIAAATGASTRRVHGRRREPSPSGAVADADGAWPRSAGRLTDSANAASGPVRIRRGANCSRRAVARSATSAALPGLLAASSSVKSAISAATAAGTSAGPRRHSRAKDPSAYRPAAVSEVLPIPKSVTLTTPSLESRTLAGVTSRRTSPASFAAPTPAAT
jgi:hypothetical protein